MSKKLLLVLLLWLTAVTAYAVNSAGDAGTSPAQFLKLGAGSRAAGMGDAYTAACDDSTAVYWNPAALINSEGTSIVMTHSAYFSDMFYDWASASFAISSLRIGAGVMYFSGGSMDAYDVLGNAAGSLSPYDMSASLSIAYDFGIFGIGVTGKYVSLNLGDTASTFTADAGLLGTFGLGGDMKLSVGASVSNITGSIKFITESANLPMDIRAGLAFVPVKFVTVAADYNMPSDNAGYFCAGADFDAPLDASNTFSVRVGYSGKSAAGGISLGAGVSLGGVMLDYAYIPYTDIGNVNKFSLSFDLGGKTEAERKARSMAKLKPVPAAEPEAQNMLADNSMLSQGMAEILTTLFYKTDKFTVLERSKIKEVLKEQAFQLSGCSSKECAVEVGKILNVKYVVLSSVSQIGPTNLLSIRVVDVESSEVMAADMGKWVDKQDALNTVERTVNGIAAKFDAGSGSKPRIAIIGAASREDENKFTPYSTGYGPRVIQGFVLDQNGKKVRRARIRIFQEGKEVDSALSRDDGSYATGELKSGTYTLVVWHATLGSASVQVEVGNAGTIELDIKMMPEQNGNVIQGFVTGTLDVPVAGALVRVYNEGKEMANLATDAEGKFKTNELKFGIYEVKVWKKGYSAGSANVSVNRGDTAKTKLQLTPLK